MTYMSSFLDSPPWPLSYTCKLGKRQQLRKIPCRNTYSETICILNVPKIKAYFHPRSAFILNLFEYFSLSSSKFKEEKICFAILMWHACIAYALKSSFSHRKFHFENVRNFSLRRLFIILHLLPGNVQLLRKFKIIAGSILQITCLRKETALISLPIGCR